MYDARQSLAAHGAITCFSSNFLRLGLDADRAPQLNATFDTVSRCEALKPLDNCGIGDAKVKRIYLIALLLLTISSPLVFSQKRAKTRSKTPTQPVKPITTPQVKDEGYDQAVKIWSEYLRRCGDSIICARRASASIDQFPSSIRKGPQRSRQTQWDREGTRQQRRSEGSALSKNDGAWGAWELVPT